MALLQAIRYHVHRLAKAESGRQESDAANEMASEDDRLEEILRALETAIKDLHEFKKDISTRVTRLERVTEAEDWR